MKTPNAQEVSNALVDYLRENVLDAGINIDPDAVLADIGIDSYSVIEMILFLERKFQIVIAEEALTPDNLRSVSALSACAVQHS